MAALRSFPSLSWLAAAGLFIAVAALGTVRVPSVSAAPQLQEGEEDEQEERRDRARRRLLRRLKAMRQRERSRELGPWEKNHDSVRDAFESVVARASQSVLRVISKGEPIALGTLLDHEGYVLTKASELAAPIECEIEDGVRVPAALAGVSAQHDLALLSLDPARVEALEPLEWSGAEEPAVGSLLATPGPGGSVLAVGIVSVPSRPKNPRGILGIELRARERGAVVDRVFPKSGAAQAGLEPGDVIIEVNGQSIETSQALIELLRRRVPGDRVDLRIRRGDGELDVTTVLGSRFQEDGAGEMDFLSGELSGRRSNFPRVLQHDTVLYPEQCGGPVVGLDGRAAGINIARAGRVESYAVPVAVVLPLVEELKSGFTRFPPEFLTLVSTHVLEDRIARLESELATEAAKAAEAARAEYLRELLRELQEERTRRLETPPPRRMRL